MKKIIVGLFAILALTACDDYEIVERSVHKVKVLEIDPPKHYYVKFEDSVTGKIMNEKVSKSCMSYNKIKIGNTYELKVEIMQNKKKERITYYSNLREVFCP